MFLIVVDTCVHNKQHKKQKFLIIILLNDVPLKIKIYYYGHKWITTRIGLSIPVITQRITYFMCTLEK